MGFRGLGFRVLGFRVWGFRVLRFRVWEFRVWGFRVQGFRVWLRCWVSGLGLGLRDYLQQPTYIIQAVDEVIQEYIREGKERQLLSYLSYRRY